MIILFYSVQLYVWGSKWIFFNWLIEVYDGIFLVYLCLIFLLSWLSLFVVEIDEIFLEEFTVFVVTDYHA